MSHSLLLALALIPSALSAPTVGDDASKLASQVSSTDERKALAAIEGLSKLGSEGVDGLLKGSQHANPWVRAAAWNGLGRLGARAKRALPAIGLHLGDRVDDQWVAAHDMAFTVGFLGGVTEGFLAKQFLPPSKSSEDVAVGDYHARAAAIRAFARIGASDPDSAARIVESTVVPLDTGYADLHIAHAFIALEDKAKARAFVEAGLASADARRQAASLLASCLMKDDARDFGPRMLELVASTEAGVRGLAAEALAITQADGGPRDVLTARTSDASSFVRVLAARGLTQYGGMGEAALPVLTACLQDPSSFVRAAAIAAFQEPAAQMLANIGKPSADAFRPKSSIAAFQKALTDKSSVVRRRAAAVLGEYGADAKSALPALRRATKDKVEDVRSAAERAIAKIEK